MGQLDTLSTRAPKELDKKQTKEETEKLLGQLDELQNLLYAEGKHAVLVILQGMDASGKDGVIKNVFSRITPQGLSVASFKAPTPEELSHDFLWRVHQQVPGKGMIRVFNRSHYEDVLITRVHGWCDDELARKRFKAINDFEEMLMQQNHTVILKFYLHISPEEQQERFKERKEDPTKFWKYNEKDYEEAKHWDEYRKMYEDVFENCNTIPWHLIPADQNWYKEHLIAKHFHEALNSLNMKYPDLNKAETH
ncbi:MAG TPA: PPK2 family polyphosphate kinase [Flavisolibacter sp.]|jgi:PPK2 family polyphosphate:nucleotide phosphotransferase|nr:PPK2 family polyphosphate kinase [Flavisolibacter sp.]